MSDAWSSGQRAVLAEMGVPLLYLRGRHNCIDEDSVTVVSQDQEQWRIIGSQAQLDSLQLSHWFRQLKRYLGDIDIEVEIATLEPTQICAPVLGSIELGAAAPDAQIKRALYLAARGRLQREH